MDGGGGGDRSEEVRVSERQRGRWKNEGAISPVIDEDMSQKRQKGKDRKTC